MKRTLLLSFFLLVAIAPASLVLGACKSEDQVAPSRPPIPVPTTTADPDGGLADGSTCFDTADAKPTEAKHFLNRCNETECFPFDNAARIEGFTPGALPPLQ